MMMPPKNRIGTKMGGSDRLDEWDGDYGWENDKPKDFWQQRDIPVDLRPKFLKCTQCSLRIPYDHETIALTINTCKNRDRLGADACHIKQTNEMLNRLKAKENGEPKKREIPRLLDITATQVQDLIDKGVPEWRRIELLGKAANDVEDAEIVSVQEIFPSGMTVPDPIRITITKNGVTNESVVD